MDEEVLKVINELIESGKYDEALTMIAKLDKDIRKELVKSKTNLHKDMMASGIFEGK